MTHPNNLKLQLVTAERLLKLYQDIHHQDLDAQQAKVDALKAELSKLS